MRARGIALVALLSTAGCQIDLLGDWGPEKDTWCEPASCGGDHVTLSVAVPMAEADVHRTDLWLSVCHAGQCAKEVQLEWSCQSDSTWCDLDCSASADVLGGHVELRRGGSCGGAGAVDGVCLEIDLPTSGLSAGETEVAVVLDEAVSGRRVVDRTFSIELAEVHVQSCAGAKTCLKGESREEIAAFDPATAAPGARQLSLESPSVSVAAAERHSCGTRADGSLVCWGNPRHRPEKRSCPWGTFRASQSATFRIARSVSTASSAVSATTRSRIARSNLRQGYFARSWWVRASAADYAPPVAWNVGEMTPVSSRGRWTSWKSIGSGRARRGRRLRTAELQRAARVRNHLRGRRRVLGRRRERSVDTACRFPLRRIACAPSSLATQCVRECR